MAGHHRQGGPTLRASHALQAGGLGHEIVGTVGFAKPGCSPGVTHCGGRDMVRVAAWERKKFTFQPRRPLQATASARWWYWIPLVLAVVVVVAAVLLGHNSPRRSYGFASGLPEGPPAGEIQVVDRSLGNGWSILQPSTMPLARPPIPAENHLRVDRRSREGRRQSGRGPLPSRYHATPCSSRTCIDAR